MGYGDIGRSAELGDFTIERINGDGYSPYPQPVPTEYCDGIYKHKVTVKRPIKRSDRGRHGPDDWYGPPGMYLDVTVRTSKTCKCSPPETAPRVTKCEITDADIPEAIGSATEKECITYTTECVDPPDPCGSDACPCPADLGTLPHSDTDRFTDWPLFGPSLGGMTDFVDDTIAAAQDDPRMGSCREPAPY